MLCLRSSNKEAVTVNGGNSGSLVRRYNVRFRFFQDGFEKVKLTYNPSAGKILNVCPFNSLTAMYRFDCGNVL